MSEKSNAALITENATVITSQTAPESITPTTDGAFRQDIIDSMWNKKDNPTPDGNTNEDALGIWMQNVQNQINSISVGNLSNPILFRATKTITQAIPGTATTGYQIYFEDDTSAPNYDNSNQFYDNQFVFKMAGTITFIIEKQKITTSGAAGGDSWKIRILKNGNEIATTSTISTEKDVYGNNLAAGFVFPSLTAIVTGVVGDYITVELEF